MASSKNDPGNPTDQLLDLFVYAPVGLALEAVDNLPKYIERGKSQVTLGRFVARTVAKKGGSTLESLGERIVNDAGQVIVDIFGIDLSPEPPASPATPDTSAAPETEANDADLPIAEYDSQAAAQIVKLLAQLSPEERELIAEHEAANRNRVTVLRKIDQLRRAA